MKLLICSDRNILKAAIIMIIKVMFSIFRKDKDVLLFLNIVHKSLI